MSRDYIDQSNRPGNALTFSLTQFLKLKCKNWAERENSNSRKSEYRPTTINSSYLDLIVMPSKYAVLKNTKFIMDWKDTIGFVEKSEFC